MRESVGASALFFSQKYGFFLKVPSDIVGEIILWPASVFSKEIDVGRMKRILLGLQEDAGGKEGSGGNQLAGNWANRRPGIGDLPPDRSEQANFCFFIIHYEYIAHRKGR